VTGFNAAALAYVRSVLKETRLTPHALATKAGISPSTLSRALNDPKHKFTLSLATIEKIAAASGINPGPFLQKDVGREAAASTAKFVSGALASQSASLVNLVLTLERSGIPVAEPYLKTLKDCFNQLEKELRKHRA
jgi:transcriptional regulator with XRE-family HTH domain